ncbi:mechanosensitive ion channel domain-containing protein [Solidesulfovibrio sp.]|uniref:mechanosensitive ion channel domain-containing protein n=1 Tax=Solidesulfovibrio sp. TaxID=2910990 RepID=UPI002623C286|nr:mechanosensitive ion channel domain-containing protein [Solidesulfovibrio sp.]
MGDMAKYFLLTTLLACGVLLSDVGPCLCRVSEAAPAKVQATAPGKHVIKAGETINLLALRYGVPAAAILKANPGLDPGRLQLGKVIVIPAPSAAASAATPPAEETPAAASAAPSAKTQNVELRPQSAPQATQPLAGGLKEHDLPPTPARPAATAVAPLPAPQATVAAQPRQAPPVAAPAAENDGGSALDKAAAALKDNAAAAVPVTVDRVGERTRFAMGGQTFFADQIVPWALSLGSRLVSGVLLFFAGVWISGRLAAVLARILRRRNVLPEIVSFAASLVRYGLYLVVLIAALGQLGFNISSLLALFGAAGLAVSLALKDTLSNFASGVMLLLFRFFRVGDRVNVPSAAGASGVVASIDVFNTVIRSDTGDVIIVPNAKIMGNVIVVTSEDETPPDGKR